MLAAEVISHLQRWDADAPPVRLYYFDRSRGETEENYFIIGDRSQFDSISEFTAAGLMAMAQRDGLSPQDFADLEVDLCEPEPWMHHYDTTARPGSMLCFSSIEVLGFEPPPQLQRKLYLVPHLSGTEEALICQSKEHYVLLYWHTTS